MHPIAHVRATARVRRPVCGRADKLARAGATIVVCLWMACTAASALGGQAAAATASKSAKVLTPTASATIASSAAGAAVPDGKAIFAARCAICHGDSGQGRSAAATIVGPSLQAEHDYGHVLASVELGPGHMPSFSYILTIPEMRAVAKYVTQQIAVIPLTGGNLSEGGKLFRVYCAACHRTSARGGAMAFTDVNAPALTVKSAALIAGTIRWGPGPMPSFPADVLSDQQLASVVDYVTFARNPPSPGGIPMHFYGSTAEGFIGFAALGLLILLSWWIEKGGKG